MTFQDVTPNSGPAEYSGLIVDELKAVSGTARDLVWHHCGASSEKKLARVHTLTEDIKI